MVARLIVAALMMGLALSADAAFYLRPHGGVFGPTTPSNCLLIGGTTTNCLLVGGTTTNVLLVR